MSIGRTHDLSKRPLIEIFASEARVSWRSWEVELRPYKKLPKPPEDIRRSAAVKTWSWDQRQKHCCSLDCYEIGYHSKFLSGHELHVKDRSKFGIRQWSEK